MGGEGGFGGRGGGGGGGGGGPGKGGRGWGRIVGELMSGRMGLGRGVSGGRGAWDRDGVEGFVEGGAEGFGIYNSVGGRSCGHLLNSIRHAS